MSGRLSGIAAALRQLTFPRELRIDAADARASGAEDLTAIVDALVAAGRREDPRGPVVEERIDPAIVRKLANVIWNLRAQARQRDGTSFDRALRARVEILEQTLEDAGIEMIDYTGQDFDEGEIWDEVLGSESRKVRPVIVSMSRPRVKYRNVVIQRGIPVVEDKDAGTPAGDAE